MKAMYNTGHDMMFEIAQYYHMHYSTFSRAIRLITCTMQCLTHSLSQFFRSSYYLSDLVINWFLWRSDLLERVHWSDQH